MYKNRKENKNNIYKMRSKGGIVFMLSLLVVLFMLSLRYGSAHISFGDFVSALIDKNSTSISSIILTIRLPRALGAMFAGIGLGISGVLLQSVTGNDLAGPNIIGVNAGAGFMMILMLFLFPQAYFLQPVVAFVGALLTTLLIIAVSLRVSHTKSTVILAGIALTSILNAAISVISLIDDDVLVSYNYFSIGSVAGVKLAELVIPMIVIICCLVASIILSKKIDMLYLGDEIALSLGLNVNSFRFLCIIISSALAASVVSYAGLLGFVGLVVPHIARILVGSNSKYLICYSALIGGCLVLLADLLGRVLLSPTEIPVGIVMSFIGVPFFMHLLLKRLR